MANHGRPTRAGTRRSRHYSKASRSKRHDRRFAARKKILDAGEKASERIAELEEKIKTMKTWLTPSQPIDQKIETEREIHEARESVAYCRNNIKIANELRAKLDAYKVMP